MGCCLWRSATKVAGWRNNVVGKEAATEQHYIAQLPGGRSHDCVHVFICAATYSVQYNMAVVHTAANAAGGCTDHGATRRGVVLGESVYGIDVLYR